MWFLALNIFARLFWRACKTLVKQAPVSFILYKGHTLSQIQGSHTLLHSKLPEFCLIFAWDTMEFPWSEHSKYQNISASTVPLQLTCPAYLLVNGTILTEIASTTKKFPEFCLSFWQNFKLPEDFEICLTFAWVCRKSHFAWVLQSRGNPSIVHNGAETRNISKYSN